MAGAKNSNFAEKLTPYLKQKLVETSEKYGIDSEEYRHLKDNISNQKMKTK